MRSSSVFRLVLVAVLLALGWTTSATAQHVQPPSQRLPTLQARSQLPVQYLPSVDAERLQEQDRRQSGEIAPYRYGVVRDTDLTPETTGTWERLASGSWVWRLRVSSPNAHSLSVGFTDFDLPDGAQVFLHGPNDDPVRGPYTAADATNGEHWTPNVQGSEVIVELVVPEEARDAVNLTVGRVVHAYRPMHPSASPDANDVHPKSGACNVDVACDPADPWRDQVRSVASYTFSSGGFSFACTGALVNNTDEDRTPYFLTAEHCITNSQEAASMVFYWNFQNPTCRAPGSAESGRPANDNRFDQTSSGALLRASYGNTAQTGNIDGRPDIALVEIDDEIPPSYNVFFAGWSRAEAAPLQGVSIHHPNGDAKRIAIDDDPVSITDYAEFENTESTHFLIEAWEVGTTEGGSSGAPLFDESGRVVGVLSGGSAGCTGTGTDNDLPDWYGRLTLAWNGGATADSRLSTWLDPAETNPSSLDGTNQSRDQQPPGPVENLTVAAVNSEQPSVTLSWISSGDDGSEGVASQYDLRYDTEPIQTEQDFQAATQATNVSTPQPPGSRESAVLDELDPGVAYYFAVRVLDEAGNRSPIRSLSMNTIIVPGTVLAKALAPNPSSTQTTLRLSTRQTQSVTVKVYDRLGRLVRRVYDDQLDANREEDITIPVHRLASGIYFLRVVGENFVQTKTLSVVH